MDRIALDAVPALVLDSIKRHGLHQTKKVNSYLETDEFGNEVLWLSLLCTVGRANPKLIVDLDFNELLDPALEQNCGELPFQLALEVQSFSLQHFQELKQWFPTDWIVRPYCVRLALEYLVCSGIQLGEEDSGVGFLLREAMQLAHFDLYYSECLPNLEPVWMDEKLDSYGQRQICATLWQSVAWDTAFKLAPEKCVKSFSGLWSVPRFGTSSIDVECTLTQKLLLEGAGATAGDDYQLSHGLCSPWQCEENGLAREQETPFAAFPYLAHPFVALRSFTGAMLLHKIFISMGSNKKLIGSITYYRLLLNLGSAFESWGARLAREGSNVAQIWSAPLRGLSVFAWQCVTDIGTGADFPQAPRNLVQILCNPRQINIVQIQKLIGQRGFFVCAHWAAQSLRRGRSSLDQTENQWLAEIGGKYGSCAQQLCERLFTTHLQHSRSSSDALELLCQKYGFLLDDLGLNGNCWADQYRLQPEVFMAEGCQVSVSDLVLARPIGLLEWRDFLFLRRACFCANGWPLVQTLRLQAAVRTPRADQNEGTTEQWFREWRGSITDSGATELGNQHLLLYALCELLRPVGGEGEPLAQANQIFLTAIDTVYSVIDTDSMFYAELISQHLSQIGPEFPFTDSTLAQAQKANLLKLMNLAQTDNRFQRLLYRFVADCAAWFQQESVHSVRQQMAIYWREQCATASSMRRKTIAKAEWNPLTDRFLLPNGEQLDVARLTQNPTKNFWNDPVTDAFHNVVDQTDRQQKLLGIIMGSRYDYCKRESCYFVNCGIGAPINAYPNSPKRRYWNGQVVILRPIGNDYVIQTTAWMPGSSEETIQIKITELVCEPVRAAMTMTLPNHQAVTIPNSARDADGGQQTARLSALLDFWCPDTSLFFERKSPIFPSNQTYEAVYNEDLDAYVPTQRNFLRLLLEYILTPGNPERTVSLTFIKNSGDKGSASMLFSTAPGVNYLLTEEDWLPGSLDKLRETLPEESFTTGLIINAALTIENDRPWLTPDDSRPWDDRNLRWAALFQPGELFYLDYDRTTHSRSAVRDLDKEKVCIQGRLMFKEEGQRIPMPHRGCNVQLVENGWDIMQQRKGQVLCEPMEDYYLSPQSCQPELVQQLIDLTPGTCFRLHCVLRKNAPNGYYLVALDNGMQAYCAAESLSMSDSLVDTLIKGRLCILESSHPQSRNDPPQTAVGIRICDADPQWTMLKGVVSRITPILDNSSTENLHQEVWLKQGEKLLKCSVPTSAFEIRPHSLGAVVTAQRQEDDLWIFSAMDRIINIRALWQLQDHTQDVTAAFCGIALGRDVQVPRYGNCAVSQDPREPVVHIWSNDIYLQDEPLCGLESEKGLVNQHRFRRSIYATFPYAKRTDLVYINQNGARQWGESSSGEFGYTSQAWSVECVLEVPRTNRISDQYDLRRVFHCESSAVEPESDRRSRFMQNVVDTYQEWLTETVFPLHITGTIHGNKLVMNGLQVPDFYDHDTIMDHWSGTVPFLPDGTRTWVAPNPNMPYSITVRAVLTCVDNVWYASCRRAKPFRVDDVLVAEFRAVSGEDIRRRLYCAGPEDDGRIRFEWGCGYCFLVRREDMVDAFGNSAGMELFYGDRIERFQLIRGNGEFGWRICIAAEEIKHETPWKIDCEARQNILQLLKIHIDRQAGTTEITHASLVEYDVGNRRIADGWTFQPFHNGTLDRGSIDELLNEEGSQEEDRTILAHLDLDRDGRKSRGLSFFYISLEKIANTPSLIAGKTLCMVAGKVSPSHGAPTQDRRQGFILPSNDYLLRFYLPDGLAREETMQKNGTPSEPQLTVSVIRRSFSLDESKLRVLYETDRANEYYRNRMLVRLSKPTPNRKYEWQGSVVGTLARPRAKLMEWVENKTIFVILDKPDKDTDLVRVEVAPGIIYMLERETITGIIQRGAIALLQKDKSGALRAEVILPGDVKYVPPSGRPVELLPMDGVIRRCYEWDRAQVRLEISNGQPTLQQVIAAEKSHFTIAGFPQILLYQPKVLEQMLPIAPPRLSYLKPDPYNNSYTLADVPFSAAKLTIDPTTRQPILHYLYPEKRVCQTDWSQLSFLDNSAEEIAAFVQRGKWHYHDKETAVRTAARRWYNHALPNGKQYSTMIFFPNAEGALRIRPEQLHKYGYSAREITENGLPVKRGAYPVAHASQNGLWIELMPGRVIELPNKYLFDSAGQQPLRDFYSQEFHPGDLVWLEEGSGIFGGQRPVLLSDFHFGARSFFSKRRNFLPVLGEGPGSSIRLGCKYRELIYPTADVDSWIGETLVYVDSGNRLGRVDENTPFLPGDTVMLTLDGEGNLAVCGYTKRLYVRVAADSAWKNAKWLWDLVRDYRKRKSFFAAMPLPLTAVVTEYGQKDERTPSITIAVQQRNIDALPVGTVICAVCLCLLNGLNCGSLLLQVGDSILSLRPERVLPGVPAYNIPHVVRALARSGQGLWLHNEEDGWYGGLARVADPGTYEVNLMLPVEQANGILCCTAKEQELRWLPAGSASRSKEADIVSLWKALSLRKTRSAQLMADGSLSLIDTNESMQRFTMLQYAPVKYRAIPLVLLDTLENGTHKYLAELYPLGDLVTLNSEELQQVDDKTVTDPITVEVSDKYSKCVYLTPLGTGRINQRLPRWINTYLGRSLWKTGVNTLSSFPREYNDYSFRRRRGDLDAAHNTIDEDFLRSKSVKINDKLCYLCALVQKREMGLSPEKRELAMLFAEELLSRWLMVQGKFLASGFDAKFLESKRNKWYVDLLPALSGILLLSWLSSPKRPDLEVAAKELSVHLTRIIGLACDSSIHIEVLLRNWLQKKEQSGFWKWLSTLSLGGVKLTGEPDEMHSGYLSMDQCRILKKVCTDIRHLSLTGDSDDLKLTADCLLYSIGELEDFRLFSKYLGVEKRDYVMNRLAVLGHTLTPPATNGRPAMAQLSGQIVTFLNEIRASLELPLCVLTDKPLPLGVSERNGIVRCCEDYERALRMG